MIEAVGVRTADDPAGNLHLVMPGQAFDAPAVTAGSHLDTVPQGGNYDGLAGVAAGLAILAGTRAAGVDVPLRALAMRCEESPWFGRAYMGSRHVRALEPAERLAACKRSDSGLTLGEHMTALG